LAQRDHREEILAEWDVKRALIHLAIPSIIGMVINGVYNVVDTIFVGRLGTESIGAVSVVFPFFMLIAGFGLAVGVGSASYISRLLGMGRKEEADQTATTALVTVVVLGLVFAALGQIFLEPLLRIFGASDTILPHAVVYARALLIGAPIIMLKMTLNNVLRAEGSAHAAMIALVTGAVLNIILDPIFIFVFNMGILGASTATIVAQAVAAGYQLWFYFSGRSYVKIRLRQFRPAWHIYSQIIKIGTPIFVTQLLNSAAMAMINAAAAPFGDAAVASMGVVKRIMALGLFTVFGYAQGFQPVAGYNYGARNFDRLWQAIRFSLRISTAFTVTIAVLFIVFSQQIISWFSNDPEVLDIGGRALRALSAPFPLLGFQLVYFSLFQALGKALPAAVLSFSRQGLLLIPAVLLLPRFFGLDGVIFAQPLADALTIAVTAVLAVAVNRQLCREASSHGQPEAEGLEAAICSRGTNSGSDRSGKPLKPSPVKD